jgi:hypothetical protein
MENYKYVCEKCDFKTNNKIMYKTHTETELHKTGKRKLRSDHKEMLKCDKCDYETKQRGSMLLHELNTHADLETRKTKFKYYCEVCDFGTFSKGIMETHDKTTKHKKQTIRKSTN